MLRCASAVVCTLAVLTSLATPAVGADYTIESVDADSGAVTAKDANGKSVTLTVDIGIAGSLSAGQTVSVDAAKGTMVVTVPVSVRGAGRDGDAQATGSAASSAKNTKMAPTGSGTVVKPDVTVTASEGSTAGAIRGRPNSSARELPNLVGEFSPNSENPDGEADDVIDLSKYTMPAPARKGGTQASSNAMTISNYSRGGGSADLINRMLKGLKDKEIDVALLGGQKYMVHDCLGLKVSAGKFKLKLANPEAKLDGTGVLFTFTIDKVEVEGLKVRLRPSANLNPCTWGGKHGVGGKVNDVRLEIRIDPVLDLERCRIADPGQIRAKVRVGSLNITDVNNEIDKAAKNMFEDAVTFALQFVASGSQSMFYNQLFQTLDDILEADCPGGAAVANVKDAAGKVASAATADQSPTGAGDGRITAKMPAGATAGETAAAPSKPYTMAVNPALKGRLGRLVIAYPEGMKGNGTRFDIFKPGDTKSLKGDYGKAEVDLMPGKYVVAVSQKKVADVEIASRQDTTLSVGGLRINAGKDTRFDVFDADKKTKLAGDYGTADIGLPVGTYYVQVAGSMEEVKVEEGKVTEF